jgi:recombination protein RecA
MAAVHRAGGIVHHMDTERTRDDKRIKKCYGLTTADFIDVDPPHLEAVWDYAYDTVKALNEEKATVPNLLVLDSLAATPAQAELEEKQHEDSHVGLQARSNAKGTRKTVRLFSDSSAIFVFVNQQRDKIGAMGYGPKTDTPGGRALKYAYSLRLSVNRLQSIKSGDAVVGQLIKITSMKNKHAPPRMEVDLLLSYRTGIDIPASNFMWFQKHKVITPNGKKGFLFNKTIPITKVGFGDWCTENEDVVMNTVDKIRAKIMSAFESDGGDDAEDGE